MFPPSTNQLYRGPIFVAWILTLISLLTIIPGMIHSFLPDGGSVAIAGLDVGDNAALVTGLFAWAGATQIAWGAIMLMVSLWYRAMVPLVLCVLLAEKTLLALQMWVLKPSGTGDHPPGAYGVLVFVPVITIMLAASLRKRPA